MYHKMQKIKYTLYILNIFRSSIIEDVYKWLEGNGSAVSWMLLHEDSAALSNVELHQR